MKFLRDHWIAPLLALFVALVVAFPLYSFPLQAGAEYQGVNVLPFGTDQMFYLARANEIMSGRFIGNPVLASGKDAHDPFFTLNDTIVFGSLRFVTGGLLSAPQLQILITFAGVFVLVLLFYVFAWQFYRSRWFASLVAVALPLGYSIIFTRRLFVDDLNLYARAMYPLFALLGTFLFLLFLIRRLDKMNAHRFGFLLPGFFFGALFYNYVYAWTYVLAFLGSLTLYFVFTKQKSKAWEVVKIGSVGVLMGAMNVWSMATTALQDPLLGYFHWVKYSHAFVPSLVGFVTLVLLAGFAYWKRSDTRMPWLIAWTAAGWIALNQQIITGRTLQYGHYYWYFVVPFFIFMLAYVFERALKPSWKPAATCLVLLVVVANGAIGNALAAQRVFPERIEVQRYAPVLSALRTATGTRPHVLAPYAEDSLLIAVYTDADLVWHDAATLYYPTQQWMEYALVSDLVLQQVSSTQIDAYLTSVVAGERGGVSRLYQALEGSSSGMSFEEYGQATSGHPVLAKHRAGILSRMKTAHEKASSYPVIDFLRQISVSHVLIDRRLTPELMVPAGFVPVVASNGLELYRLR